MTEPAAKQSASTVIAEFVLIVLSALCYLPLEAYAHNITLVAQLQPSIGTIGDVWGEGNYAYLGTSPFGSGVAIIDVSDPTSPFLAAYYNPTPPTQFADVKVHNGIGYFAIDDHPDGGVHIVDLSDPTQPSLISLITSAQNGYDGTHNVFYSNGYLYVVDLELAVKVFDVRNPANPLFVRDINSPRAHDITVIDDRLYVSLFDAGRGPKGLVHIYDVRDVGLVEPTLLSSFESGAFTHSSWASSDGNILVTTQEIEDGDVRIYDISDLDHPVLLSSIDRKSLCIDASSPHNPVLYDDGLLFVSWNQAGVVALDIRNPSEPVLVGNYDTLPGELSNRRHGNWGVYPFLGLDRVLLSDRQGGLFIVDATLTQPPPAFGPPSKIQQRCILDLNKSLAKVAKAQAKNIDRCLRDYTKGSLSGQTLEECTIADNRGRVAQASATAATKSAARCTVQPDFGATDAATVISVAVDMELGLMHEIFGADLDAAITSSSAERPTAECQVSVAKEAKRCTDTILKAFNNCKRKAVKCRRVEASAIEDCLGADPHGRIARACDPLTGKIRATIDKMCGGVDFPGAFPELVSRPGCSTIDAAAVAECLEQLVECRVCLALNEADALDRDCDEFDDGVVNGSCP